MISLSPFTIIYCSIISLMAGLLSWATIALTKKHQAKFERSLNESVASLQALLPNARTIPALEQLQESALFKKAPSQFKFKKSWTALVPYWIIIALGMITDIDIFCIVGLTGLVYYAVQTTSQYLTREFKTLTTEAMRQSIMHTISIHKQHAEQQKYSTPIELTNRVSMAGVIPALYRDLFLLTYHGCLNSLSDIKMEFHNLQNLDKLAQHLDNVAYDYGHYLANESPSIEKELGLSLFFDLILRATSLARTSAYLTIASNCLANSENPVYTWEQFLNKTISELETQYPNYFNYNGYV